MAYAMERLKSFVTLVKNWKRFGERLGVHDVELLDLERRLKIGDVQLREIPSELMKIWKADQGTNATLGVIHKALVDCGVKDIADILFTQYWNPELMQTVKFMWQDEVVTLDELLGENIPPETYQMIFEELKKCFPKQPIQLIKQELMPPVLPKYYIPRTLFYIPSTELDKKLFTSESAKEDVFLFKGIKKHEIARLAGYKAVALSGDQLRDVNVFFIELQCEEDFERICKNTTKPVHVIEHKDGRYYWVKSSKNLELIRQFLKEEGKNVDEQEFVTRIRSLTLPSSMSIADSPGMGKTLVLAKLAMKMRESSRRSINLFIVLQEFILEVSSSSSALEAIASYSSCNQVSKIVLMELLRSDSYQLNVFLDGYDEVMQDKLDTVDSFLKQLQKRNVKVIVTTRPHLQTRLELIFNQFSYQIRPFNVSNQIDCLTEYWIDKNVVEEGEALKSFAKKCLSILQTKLTDKDKTIAGIPLQCMMLAEVYVDDAKRVSTLTSSGSENENVIQPFSLFDMYKKLIELKLKRSPNQNYANFHVREAMALLFPSWVDVFKNILKGLEEINEDTLYAIGLLEKSPNQNAPRFIHRTFAEYLLAEFIVNNLSNYRECVNLLFGEILGRKGSNIRDGFIKATQKLDFDYPVIAYFIELHLKKYSSHNVLEGSLPKAHSRLFQKTKFRTDDVCVALRLCCEHELECTFDYAAKVLHNYWIWYPTRDLYFKGLPNIVVLYSNNVEMLKKVLNFTKSKFGVGLSYHNLVDFTIGSAFFRSSLILDPTKFTILHMAVCLGKYNFVTYLVDRYGDKINKLEHLLAFCVNGSADNNRSVIEDKLLILDMLVKINPRWLEEKVIFIGRTPLIQDNVHLSLLKRLVEHGADINACSNYGETVLHCACDNEDYRYTDVVRWALSNGFTLICRENSNKQTPLMHAIHSCGTFDDEGIKLFLDAGADFNAEDENGNSVLFYALQHAKDVDFIKKLLECGVNVNHRNNEQQNAVHKVIIGRWDSEETLILLKLLKSKGLKFDFNQKDLHGFTLLDVARSQNKTNEELLKFKETEIQSL